MDDRVRNEADTVAQQRLALACCLAVFCGILVGKVSAHSFDRVLAVWIVCVAASGVILADVARGALFRSAKLSMLAGTCFSAGFAGYIVARVLASAVTGFPDGRAVTFSGIPLDYKTFLKAWPLLLVIGVFFFFVTALGVLLTTLAGNLLFQAVSRVFQAGPETITRARNVLIGLGTLAAALFALWNSLG